MSKTNETKTRDRSSFHTCDKASGALGREIEPGTKAAGRGEGETSKANEMRTRDRSPFRTCDKASGALGREIEPGTKAAGEGEHRRRR